MKVFMSVFLPFLIALAGLFYWIGVDNFTNVLQGGYTKSKCNSLINDIEKDIAFASNTYESNKELIKLLKYVKRDQPEFIFQEEVLLFRNYPDYIEKAFYAPGNFTDARNRLEKLEFKIEEMYDKCSLMIINNSSLYKNDPEYVFRSNLDELKVEINRLEGYKPIIDKKLVLMQQLMGRK
jgi:hypothetical protein